MGADLIGYLVKGPAHIETSGAVLQRAITQPRTVISVIRDWQELCDKIDTAQAPPEALEQFTFSPCHALAEEDLDTEFFRVLATHDPEGVVQTFIAFWNRGGSRDSLSRQDPDDPTQRIVFAGEMSWGDEPLGEGYDQFQTADVLGILGILGIR